MTGGRAQSNNPETFATFEQAIFAKDMNGYEGVGIGIFGDICAIDIDHCIDDNTGAFSDMAMQIVKIMDSYTEVSPSGAGLRILFRAPGMQYDKEKYYINNQKIGLEIYAAGYTNKYVTITGNAVQKCDIQNRADELKKVLDLFMCREVRQNHTESKVLPVVTLDMNDQELCDRAARASNGQLFQSLMNGDTSGYGGDHSKADLALCNILAFYTKDADQIDRIFRSSGLMREKWDRKTGASTYGAITVQGALTRISDQYTAGRKRQNDPPPAPPVPAAPVTVEAKSVQTAVAAEPEDGIIDVRIGFPKEVRCKNPNTGQRIDLQWNAKFTGPSNSIENFCRILEQDKQVAGVLCYNEVAYRRWVRGSVPWEPKPIDRAWTNSDESWLRRWVWTCYGIKSKEDLGDAVTIAESQRKINPIREFLDGLAWDGVSRIGNIMTDYLGVEPTEYNIAAFRVWLFGAVARAYHPGTKFDYAIVFAGPQGCGKSTFLSRLAIQTDWFNDGLKTLDGDAKKVVEQLSGRWILELGELAALKRTQDLESIKQFITAQFDVYRVPYDKYEEQRPRACVFAGTTNSLSFLADKSGGRRFLPIDAAVLPASKSLFDRECKNDFAQLWAEVVSLYKAGEYSLKLSDEMESQAEAHREFYEEEDVREGIIQQWLDETTCEFVCVPMIFEKALQEYGRPTRRISNEIHEIMRRKITGWELYSKSRGKARCGSYGVQLCYVRSGRTVAGEEKLGKGELL